MIILPAIDILDEKPVRLFQGDYDQREQVAEDILQVAKDFESQGATWLHMVDLQGALKGERIAHKKVREVVEQTNLKVEIGGGIRTMDGIDHYIDIGASRIILGSAAVKDRELLKAALKKYGEAIAVGIDILDGYVKVQGWSEDTNIYYRDFIQEMENLGVATIIVTDISKDGAMVGTNYKLYKELSETVDIQLIASGGISNIEEVRQLAQEKIYGAIIGKAIYNGSVDLKEAIEVGDSYD